jgi:hypothetical protein
LGFGIAKAVIASVASQLEDDSKGKTELVSFELKTEVLTSQFNVRRQEPSEERRRSPQGNRERNLQEDRQRNPEALRKLVVDGWHEKALTASGTKESMESAGQPVAAGKF